MSFAPVYLLGRLLYRIGDFFHNWYVHGSRMLFGRFRASFEQMEQVFAVRTTVQYFFQPLFKDYSIIGRILGVIFRSGRILIGLAVYSVVGTIFSALYLAWTLFPVFIVLYAAY